MTDEHTPFDPKGGKFADNIRNIDGDDASLRESMKQAGWIEFLPAFVDENDVVIVGHRRLKIAKELGIKPVITKVRFGKGDDADTKRLQLAIASNTGGKGLTQGDRKRIAEYLYSKLEWTQVAIAEAMNVSQSTIRDDLRGLVVTTKPSRPKGGRPKSTEPKAKTARQSTRGKTTPKLDAAREIIRPKIEAGEAVHPHKLQDEHGISHVTFDMAITAELARKEALAEPLVDREDLSLSAQQRFDLAVKQEKQRLALKYEQDVLDEVRRRIDEIVLPSWKERIEEARTLYDRRKGIMDKATWNKIRGPLHPDRLLFLQKMIPKDDFDSLVRQHAVAFDTFMSFRKKLLPEKDDPTDLPNVPDNLAAWDKMKADASAQRKRSKTGNAVRRQ